METKRLDRVKKSVNLHLAMEAKDTLKKLEEDFPDNPVSMDYFYSLFRSIYCEGKPLETEKQVIGTMCKQVPEELIYAAGAVPVRICNGAYAFDQVGAEFMPSKSCSLVKATMGMMQLNQFVSSKNPDMVIIPTTCDQKRKAGELLTEMGFNVYMLETPPTKDTEEARYYWHNSIKKVALKLQETTGQKITKTGLIKAVNKLNRARQEYRRLLNLRLSSPPLIYGKDVFLLTNAYFFDDINSWTRALSDLNDELERKKSEGFSAGNRHAPRFLFTGSPPVFPNLKLPLLIEESGGIVVADDVCSSTRLLYDTVTYDEANLYDIIPAIADRYLKPCTCPCFVPNSDRKRRLIEMVKDFAVDGVIYQAYSGCQLYEMEQKSVSNSLANEGIPMIYIETDYSPEDGGQLSTRVEAFIESIKSKKRRK